MGGAIRGRPASAEDPARWAVHRQPIEFGQWGFGVAQYSIPAFIQDAKRIIDNGEPLAARQAEIAERLSALSKRDDLLRHGLALGPADASTQNFLVYREKPHVFLAIAQFDEHYVSPIHEHDDYWVIACGYRGRDRWDMWERLDDGSEPGHADLRMYDQYPLPPGATAIMQPPPKSIHSHNNEYAGSTLELIFSMAEPSDPNRRIIYDPEEKGARLSQWKPNDLYLGGDYPGPRLSSRDALQRVGAQFNNLARRALCPICATARAAGRAASPGGFVAEAV